MLRLVKRSKWVKSIKFWLKSHREMRRQFKDKIISGEGFREEIRLLNEGGTIPSVKMLHEAINADYLSPKKRREEIIKWAKQIGVHVKAAKSRQKKLSLQERHEINLEVAELVRKSLKKAGII